MTKTSAWESLPEGWTEDSLKSMWESLTGDRKHKVTACIKKMEGKVDDAGAFCASLADKMEPGWRENRAALIERVASRYRKASAADDVRVLKSLQEGDKVKVEAAGLRRPRVLTVTSVQPGSSYSVYTSSGHTRPGHIGGGLLTHSKSYGDQVMYQATPLQQITEVIHLSKV